MELSNTLIYDGRLRCGSEEVAKRSLKLPDGGAFMNLLHGGKRRAACQKNDGCWLERVMEERFVFSFKLKVVLTFLCVDREWPSSIRMTYPKLVNLASETLSKTSAKRG